MLRSASSFSVLISVLYFITVIALTGAASGNSMCGDGDYIPPCGWFALGLIIYSMLGILGLTIFGSLLAAVLRRRVPILLKSSCLLTIVAVCALILPVRAAGNKFAGAIVVISVFPSVLLLITAASVCVVVWLGKLASNTIGRGGSVSPRGVCNGAGDTSQTQPGL